MRKIILNGLLFIILIYNNDASRAQDHRQSSTCYRLIEADQAISFQQSPLVLCLTSSNLDRYPHGVVTFVLKTIAPADERQPASAPFTEGRVIAKRHYSLLGPGRFGHKQHSDRPLVIFDGGHHVVFLGFVGSSGKRYFYKQI